MTWQVGLGALPAPCWRGLLGQDLRLAEVLLDLLCDAVGLWTTCSWASWPPVYCERVGFSGFRTQGSHVDPTLVLGLRGSEGLETLLVLCFGRRFSFTGDVQIPWKPPPSPRRLRALVGGAGATTKE